MGTNKITALRRIRPPLLPLGLGRLQGRLYDDAVPASRQLRRPMRDALMQASRVIPGPVVLTYRRSQHVIMTEVSLALVGIVG